MLERKIPVSLVVITKNVEPCLEKCLQSSTFVSEIVVVDSGSTDGTVEIAKKYGAKVLRQDWLGFGPQKNFAVNQASFDWVLCLDADEYLSPSLQKRLIELFQQQPECHAYRFARSNKFLGRFLRHGEGYPDWSLRLFNRQFAQWSSDHVHEKVIGLSEPLRKTGQLDGDLMHESGESIHRYLEKQNVYTSIQASEMLKAGYKPSVARILLSPLVRFLKYYVLKFGFLDGVPGLIHILIGCFTVFLKYVKVRAG